MDRMHRQGAKNADHIREISATFQELITNLRDLTMQPRDSKGDRDLGSESPQVTLQSATLEQELDDCYDRFQSIGAASNSVRMTKRSTKNVGGEGMSGATGGSRPDRASPRTLSSSSSHHSHSSNSVASMDVTSDTGGPTAVPASSPGGGDRVPATDTTGRVKRNPVPSASAARAKARASKGSGAKSSIPLAKK